MASTQPAIQKPSFDVFREKVQKINRKTFHRETYFAYFGNLSTTFYPRLSEEKEFYF